MADYQSSHSGPTIDERVTLAATNQADIAALKLRMSSAETSINNKADTSTVNAALATKQNTLVSGTNIKTVGGQNILGSGNIPVNDENAVKFVAQTLTDAQKAQARTNIDAASTEEVSQLRQEVTADVSQLEAKVEDLTIYTTEETLTPSNTESGKIVLEDGTISSISSTYARVYTFSVLDGWMLKVSGRVGNIENACLLAFYDSNGIYISGSSKYPTTGAATPYLDVEAITPANARFIKVSGSTSQDYLPAVKRVVVDDTVKGKIQDIEKENTEFVPIDISEMTGGTYIIDASGLWTYNRNYDTVLIPIEPGKTYKLVNIRDGNSYYAPLTNNSHTSGDAASFASGYSGRVLIQSGKSAVFIAPADAHYLYVIRKYSNVSSTSVYECESHIYARINDCEERIAECESEIAAISVNDKIVEMELERGTYDASGNYNIGYVLNDAYLRTPNFLKLPDDGIFGVRTDSPATMVVLRYYKDDYTFLSGVSATALEASGFTEFTAPTGAVYVKMNFRNASSTAITPGKAYFRGKFADENPIYYNVRPTDSGYQTLEVRVNLYNPTACDATTDSVQDNSTVGVDYGVLAIPARYVNRGAPTRLIIYCHGAAVNYPSGANRFDSQDLNPDYWLSEGYAVMDVEGNPFDNVNEHFGIPQAYQCYKAAYEWVIAHYNIRKDGVFLGGRSMGGLMTLDIITQERGIPVIAACPNVPCVVPTWYWNYMNADRRVFCANHLGFVNQPTWTGTSPMPSAEWDCLKANFDKLALASPFWRLLNDLPGKDDLFNETNVSRSSNDPTSMLAVYGNCRFRVKTPVKLFLVRDDSVAIPEMNGDILAKIAKQSGQIFVVRNFLTGGHHYDTQNQDLQVTITNTYGESVTTSVVYIEMLAWWRECEQRS